MSITETTCLLLTCNMCGRQAQGFEDVYTVHFKDREELEKYAADAEWVFDADVPICWACRGKDEPEVFDR